MSLFDLVLLLIIGGFALFGLWFGVVATLGSLVGTVFGVYLASRWYVVPATWLINATGWNANFSNILVFIILYLIINRLIGFIFYIIDKSFSIITHLPFINSLNHLLGGLFGFIEGVVALGITFYFVSRFPLSPAFMAAASASRVVPFCVSIAGLLWPLAPEAIRALQNALQNIIH
ncbi:MAG: CvpA family protein [Candidatus Magasanikbacteria bacterium]|nr:CvpA family protein [Candidatus Magasanikbacteria bacterium]